MARRVQEGARVGDVDVDLGNQFDHVFWAGDLNYRVDLARFKSDSYLEASFEDKWNETARMIGEKRLAELQKYEELGTEVALGNVFAGFTDAMLADSEKNNRYFAPTFKVVRHKRGEYIKKRVSSWCDRVLWCAMDGSENCADLQGITSDPSLTTSDHKPVYARYRLAIPRSLAEIQAERSLEDVRDIGGWTHSDGAARGANARKAVGMARAGNGGMSMAVRFLSAFERVAH